jgi:hypothetical protein
MAFAILQEQAGRRHWVRTEVSEGGFTSNCMTTALLPAPVTLQYGDRDSAERDAEIFRERNARAVEATKRKRKYKEEPATYSVVPVVAKET